MRCIFNGGGALQAGAHRRCGAQGRLHARRRSRQGEVDLQRGRPLWDLLTLIFRITLYWKRRPMSIIPRSGLPGTPCSDHPSPQWSVFVENLNSIGRRDGHAATELLSTRITIRSNSSPSLVRGRRHVDQHFGARGDGPQRIPEVMNAERINVEHFYEGGLRRRFLSDLLHS